MAKASAHSIEGIRDAILDGGWTPGARLQPTVLAVQFSTSATVIRESLTRLSGEGLVEIKPNRGFFVPELNLQELADITELRCVTEALAARLAVERGDLAWEAALIASHHKLSKAPRRLASSPGQFSPQWGQAHREFHQLLLSPCACPPMLTLSANLANSTLLYRRWASQTPAATARDVENEHQLILEAALARKPEELARLLRIHYEATAQVILASGSFPADAISH